MIKHHAEESKIKLPTFVGSWRKRGSSGKISACASLTTLKPITSWQIEREKWKQWQTLFSWAPKITVDGDCSHEIKRCLLLGRKVMTNLDSILKGRNTTWPTKVPLVKAMVFPVVMYACGSWTVKKAEHWRIDAFELWCWRTLESPLDCKEIQPVHSKDQSWVFFGKNDAKTETPVLWPPHAKSWLIGKDSEAGRDWGRRKRGWQRMRWLDGITDSMDMSLSEI